MIEDEEVVIAGRPIGGQHAPYVIAELSANHRGSRSAALEVVAAAAEAGADAIKLQHYTSNSITVRSDHPDFLVSGGTAWDGRQLHDLYAEGAMPWEWTSDIVAEAEKHGLTWFSTPFDSSAVDFLLEFEVPAFKIASFELIDLPLIRRAAATGKPLIMSTGMATEVEIDAALAAAQGAKAGGVILLRCNSSYPAVVEEMDLQSISKMRSRWQVPIGLSDHTLTTTSAVVATALGACVFEKHLTLKRSDGGPDSGFSLEPDEFSHLVREIHDAYSALGVVRFGPSPSEQVSVRFRPSLRAVEFIPEGAAITSRNVRSVRPAGGLPPDAIAEILNRTVVRAVQVGEPITEETLS